MTDFSLKRRLKTWRKFQVTGHFEYFFLADVFFLGNRNTVQFYVFWRSYGPVWKYNM